MVTKKFTGISNWAKVRKPDQEFQRYTLDHYLNEEGWAEFNETGFILEPREDKEGEKYVKWGIAVEEKVGESIRKNGPPLVYLRDEQTGEYNLWKEGLIGNGSLVTVVVEIYPTKRKGMGHRLLRVFVDKLVVYEGMKEEDAPAPATAQYPF